MCCRLLQRELRPSKRCFPLSSWPAASWEMSSFTVCYHLFIYFGCAWSLSLHELFSPIVSVSRGLFSSCSAWMYHCGGFSCCRTRAFWVHGLQSLWLLGSESTDWVVVPHGISYYEACGTFLDQGSIPCNPRWKADSLPVSHQGSKIQT